MVSLFVQLATAAAIIGLLFLKNFIPLSPLLGIYRQNSKYFYLKLGTMLTLLTVRKRKSLNEEDIDRRQPLSDHPMAIDAVYFNGMSKDQCIVAFGTAQRKKQLVNAFCVLRVPQFSDRMLVLPRFPDTCMRQTKQEYDDTEAWVVEGIHVKPVVPMRSWKLTYNGKMKYEDGSSGEFDVKIEALWTSSLPSFSMDTDISKLAVARAIAMEPWSRDYFENIDRFHQTHYEHYGDIQGTATINGTDYPIATPAIRDHSFGEVRDWKLFHRYVMHMFTLDNGDRITVGVISTPVNFSKLQVGFVTLAKEKKNYAITSVDFELYQHGEFGQPPKDYAFTFWADGRQYVVQVKSDINYSFYIGEKAEGRFVEMYSEFTVNGVKGTGFVEWQYRNVNGFPKA